MKKNGKYTAPMVLFFPLLITWSFEIVELEAVDFCAI